MNTILKEFEARGSLDKSRELLTVLVADLRKNSSPRKKGNQPAGLDELIQILKENPVHANNLRWHIRNLILGGRIEGILTDSGVAEGGSFFNEFFSRLRHLLLPALVKNEDLGETIRKIFYKPGDLHWLMEIPDSRWKELFELLGMSLHTAEADDLKKIFDAATALSFRISGTILDTQFKEYESLRKSSGPFIRQTAELEKFRQLFEGGQSLKGKGHKLFEELEKCRLAVDKIKRDRADYGAGLQQTFLLVKLERQIARLKIITSVLDDEIPVDVARTVIFFKRIVYFELRKNNPFALISDNVGLLAFQISEHKSHTGEHYITTSRKEYFSFFLSACGGGFFAPLMGLIKLMIEHLQPALFWQHFGYSVNYALGFVGIHITGSTLATKQPSMTAAALAGSLDAHKTGTVEAEEIALTFGKVWRSQFVAFAGNLAVTFPFAFLLAFLYDIITGAPIAEGKEAVKLLAAQNPAETPVYIYASITGIMLFLSGIISGYYDNLVLFSRIPERLENHPTLKKFLPAPLLKKVAGYTKYNLGSWAGNISLGFLLGFPAFFGKILGIPLDIRHITISTAHYAMGIYGTLSDLDWYHIIWGIVGIVIIGFLNFLVSFSLAFWIAIKSRNIRFSGYLSIPRYIWTYLKKYPWDFVYPPKNGRNREQVFN